MPALCDEARCVIGSFATWIKCRQHPGSRKIGNVPFVFSFPVSRLSYPWGLPVRQARQTITNRSATIDAVAMGIRIAFVAKKNVCER